MELYIYMHACIVMTRVISLSDRAYEELKKLKKGGESFSDVVIKVTRKEKKPLIEFLGAWPDKKEATRVAKELENERRRVKTRDVDF